MFEEEKSIIGPGFQEEHPEKSTGEKAESASGDDILRGVLEKTEQAIEMDKIQEEAIKENERRKALEYAKAEAQERYEDTSKRAYVEGLIVYTAMEAAREWRRLIHEHHSSPEEFKRVEQEALNYLKTHYEEDPVLGYHKLERKFKESFDGAIFGGYGKHLEFGPYTFTVKDSFSKEGYFKAMDELKEVLDKNWQAKAEKVEQDELTALNKKTEYRAFERHLEGFGRAALDHNDLVTAVEAFIKAGMIENPEIARSVSQKIEEMLASGKEEEKVQVVEAREKIQDYLESKKEQG